MNPNYLEFIRFQDKRMLLFIYGTLFVVMGFYWKNSGYHLNLQDMWLVSGLLSIVLFNFICDLKSYWAYSYLLRRVNFENFIEKPQFFVQKEFLFRPLIISIFSIFLFLAVFYSSLLFSSKILSIFYLFFISALLIYLTLRGLRPIYIQQLFSATSSHIKYKNFYHYVSYSVVLVTILNVISISPLANNSDFSIEKGFLSAHLVVAVFILCCIVFAINMAFSRISQKRYNFLGRIFLEEFSFQFSEQIPCRAFYEKPLIIRLLILLVILFVWIIGVSIILSLLQWKIIFEFYFLLCFLPCIFYYFLHTYWQWHAELMFAYDMYFRSEEINKRKI